MDTVFYPGYRFFKTLTLSEEDIRQGALACGDMNYIHHDADQAITMEWQIEQINPKAGGKTTLTLTGNIVEMEGNVLVLATAAIMLFPSL